jgi:hypothetical protein
MHAQPLRHFVLKEIELLTRDQQLFSESQFWHKYSSQSSVVSYQSLVAEDAGSYQFGPAIVSLSNFKSSAGHESTDH